GRAAYHAHVQRPPGPPQPLAQLRQNRDHHESRLVWQRTHHLSPACGYRWRFRSRQSAERPRPVRALPHSWSREPRGDSWHFALQCGGYCLVVGERYNTIANDLSGLVTLAGNQQHVSRFEISNCFPDRFRAIANFRSPRRMRQNSSTDGGGTLGARVVVRNDNPVRILCRYPAHNRAFASISVAPRAEYHNKFAAGIGPKAFKRLLQRVRLVGIVDK